MRKFIILLLFTGILTWSTSCHQPDVSGTWIGELPISSGVRTFSFQLHQRDGGQISGYILGGTDFRTVVDGTISGTSMSVTVELKDPGLTRILTVNGTVRGNRFEGTVSTDSGPRDVVWNRTSEILHERRLLFAKAPDSDEDPVEPVQVGVVMDDRGGFVSGGFVATESCDLLACGGGLTSFEESGGTLTMGLEASGGRTGAIHATFNESERLYSGSYSFGSKSGDVIGARATRTRSDHVAGVLETLGRIADQFEHETPFETPHASFASDYMHNTKSADELFEDYNGELDAFENIEVILNRFTKINTEPPEFVFPDIDVPVGAEFHMTRTGISAGGTVRETIVDFVSTNPPNDRLRLFTREDGNWRLIGNQQPPLDLPFDYTLPAGGTRLQVESPEGPVHTSIGVFGAHFGPLTGHEGGDAKANFVGFIPSGDEEMVELEGNGDGVRQSGELWGYPGGLDGSGIRNHRPVYRAPQDGEILYVMFERTFDANYFDTEPHWDVGLKMGNIEYRFDHVGAISQNLRLQILEATGGRFDTDTFTGPEGTDLLGDVEPITVEAGEALCYPQIWAEELDREGYPGYFVGGGGYGTYPWVQMEWFVTGPVEGTTADVCMYQYFEDSLREDLQSLLGRDMTDPNSVRFGARWETEPWQFRAEGRLCMNESTFPHDFSRLYSKLGGWFDTGSNPDTPELLAWCPIAPDSPAYDPSLYDPDNIGVLVLRRRHPDRPFYWELPDGTTETFFYPAGEVIEKSADSFLVKWRLVDSRDRNHMIYQWAAYRLDTTGLTVKWGEFSDTRSGAVLPAFPADPIPNDEDLLHYDHENRAGY